MEITKIKDHQQRAQKKQNGQSSSYKVTQRFIPPTHPAYVVTSNFTAPHILTLQDEFDKNYIAMSMQTSKKKLSKIPDAPTDKFFIVTDDSAGPTILNGQFLTLNKKVINYPISNNTKEVIQEFNSYIGLGHKEVKEQRLENRYNMEEKRQARQLEIQRARIQLEERNRNAECLNLNGLDQNALTFNPSVGFGENTATAHSGFSGRSKIVFREVSSRKEEMKISQGKLFIYDNRKDSASYKSLVQQIKTKFGDSKEIVVIRRIDEYNYYCMKNRETSHIIMMSQTAYLTLSEYFTSYHSFAVFGENNEKIQYHRSQNIVIYTSNTVAMLKFVEQFRNKKQGLDQEKRKKVTDELKAFSNKNLGMKNDKIEDKDKLKSQLGLEQPLTQELPSQLTAQRPVLQLGSPLNRRIASPDIRLQEKTERLPDEKGRGRLLRLQNSELRVDGERDKDIFLSPKKSKISLIKITDLDKDGLKMKSLLRKPQQIQVEKDVKSSMNSPYTIRHLKSKVNLDKADIASQKSSEKISVISANKIKRLKSCRKFKDNQSQNQKKVQEDYQLPIKNQHQSKAVLRPSVKTHLRTGSDHQQYMRIQKDQDPKHSFQEGQISPKGKLNAPSIIIGSESSKESYERCVRYPQKHNPSESKKRCSISRKEVAQGLRIHPTFQKSMENSESSKKSEERNKFLRTSLVSPTISPDSSSKKEIFVSPISSKIVPLSEAVAAEQSSDDDNVMMVKKPEVNGEGITSWNKKEEEKKEESEEDNQVYVVKPQSKDKDQLEKNKLTNNVKSAQDKFDDIMINKEASCYQERKKQKVTLKKEGGIPPETQNIENSIQQSKYEKLSPNFKMLKVKGEDKDDDKAIQQTNYHKDQLYQSEKLFGESEPSEIKNQNPLILINSPKKILQDENPRLSFGIIPGDLVPLKIQREKGFLVVQPSQNTSNVGTDRKPQEKENIIPLKSRKRTDKNKNQNIVNKIFRAPPPPKDLQPKKQEKDTDFASKQKKVKEEDPYGLPLLKSYKKKNTMKAAENIFKEDHKEQRDEDKIGKIYSTLKTTSSQSKFIPNDQKNSNRSDSLRMNRVNSVSFPSKLQQRNPRSTLFTRTQSNEPRQTPNRPNDTARVRTIRVRSIEDYIDLDKYDKVIQNGVTIYRAKSPLTSAVSSTVYKYPSSLPTDSKPEFFSSKIRNFHLPSSYSDNKKYPQNNKNQPHSCIQTNHTPPSFQPSIDPKDINSMNQEVKALTYQICKNILTKSELQPKNSAQKPFQQRPINRPENHSPYHKNVQKPPLPKQGKNMSPKQSQMGNNGTIKKNQSISSPKTVENKLKKALSHSKGAFINLKQDKYLTKVSQQKLKSLSQDSISSQSPSKTVDNKYESMVLYLISKSKEIDYPEIQLLQNDKDSIVYYKNEKQLAQLILKSENVYDLVYIMTPSLTPQMKKIIKHFPNCFEVTFDSQNCVIKNHSLSVPTVEELEGVTKKLVRELSQKRRTILTVPTSPQPLYKHYPQKRMKKREVQHPKQLTHHCCCKKPLQHQCSHKICSQCGEVL